MAIPIGPKLPKPQTTTSPVKDKHPGKEGKSKPGGKRPGGKKGPMGGC